MKHIKTGFALLLILTTMAMFVPLPASASQGAVTVTAAPAGVGDTVEVTVSFSAPNIGAVTADFRYEAACLSYLSGSQATAADGSGKIVLVADAPDTASLSTVLKFRALSACDTTLHISVGEMIDFLEGDLGTPEADFTLSIGEAMPANDPSPAVTTKDGKIICALPASLPPGYSRSFAVYGNTPIEVAKNGVSTLVYVCDADGNDGGFYFLDGATGDLKMALGGQSIVLLPLPASLPQELASLSTTSFAIGGRQIDGLSLPSSSALVVYGVDALGSTGFYLYDRDRQIFQSYHNPTAELTLRPAQRDDQAVPVENQGFAISPVLFSVLAGILGLICIILIATLVVIKNKGRKGGHYA